MSELPPPPYHPVPEAIRAYDNGKYPLSSGLHVRNPYTGEYAVATTVTDENNERKFQIDAPNGRSYWTLQGEHISGFHPEGSRPPNFPPDVVLTDELRTTLNAFIQIIWAGVR